jgi:heme/copper-type cytochrome/quinol oxidase subunit 1
MYLWFSFAMFLLGGAFAMIIRAELFQPGMQLVEPAFFNQMTTLHGLIMVFGAIMPAFVGLANWMIPMMIGAPDMALPRMNNWSFWILPPRSCCWPPPCSWKAARRPSAGPSTRRCPPPTRRRRSPSSSSRST